MARALTPEQLLAWKDRIERQPSSGLSVSEFCRREQVSEANFYHRKRKLKGTTVRQRAASGRLDRRAVGSKTLSSPTAARPQALEQPGATPDATFFQIPLLEPRGGVWIEIVSPHGTVIRLPQQNLAAFELALAALNGRNGD